MILLMKIYGFSDIVSCMRDIYNKNCNAHGWRFTAVKQMNF